MDDTLLPPSPTDEDVDFEAACEEHYAFGRNSFLQPLERYEGKRAAEKLQTKRVGWLDGRIFGAIRNNAFVGGDLDETLRMDEKEAPKTSRWHTAVAFLGAVIVSFLASIPLRRKMAWISALTTGLIANGYHLWRLF